MGFLSPWELSCAVPVDWIIWKNPQKLIGSCHGIFKSSISVWGNENQQEVGYFRCLCEKHINLPRAVFPCLTPRPLWPSTLTEIIELIARLNWNFFAYKFYHQTAAKIKLQWIKSERHWNRPENLLRFYETFLHLVVQEQPEKDKSSISFHIPTVLRHRHTASKSGVPSNWQFAIAGRLWKE